MEDIKRELEKEFTDHPDKNKIVGFTIGLITKHRNNPHPSDSNIERYNYALSKGSKYEHPGAYMEEDKNGDYVKYEDYKRMRDRMNVEMCEYKELVFRLAEWSKKYPRGRIYGASRQESMDGELIEMEEAAKTILQKFRNRDL